MPAFGLIHRSKSETQGLLSRRGRAICARLGLLFLGLAGQQERKINREKFKKFVDSATKKPLRKHQALPKRGLFTSSSEAGSTSLAFPHCIALPSLKQALAFQLSRSLVDPNLYGSGSGYWIWIKKGQNMTPKKREKQIFFIR